MDVEAHLLPTIQQLEQTALEATMRIRSTPLYTEMASLDSSDNVQSPLDRFSKILAEKFSIL